MKKVPLLQLDGATRDDGVDTMTVQEPHVEKTAVGISDTSRPAIQLVSLCTIALNEEAVIGCLLADFEAQDFPHERIELVLVDSGSTDRTRAIMEEFVQQARGFHGVKVVDNPKRVQPSGWNVAIAESAGDIIIRVDAHASIPADFVSRNVGILEQGEDVCGGYRPTALLEPTPWRETLLLAEQAALGGGLALNRKATQARYVSTLFHGAYRREVFAVAGVFDERLMRTEDNELHYRIRKAGYRIRFDPAINSRQFIRNSLQGMLRQKYANGFWIGLTLYVCPGCISLYHAVPLGFVLVLALAALAGVLLSWLPFIAVAIFYALANVGLSLSAFCGNRQKNATMIALPLIVFIVHLCYGWGSIVGILRGLFWNKKDRI